MERIITAGDCHAFGYQLLASSSNANLPNNVKIVVELSYTEFYNFKNSINVDLPAMDRFNYFGVPGIVFEIKVK